MSETKGKDLCRRSLLVIEDLVPEWKDDVHEVDESVKGGIDDLIRNEVRELMKDLRSFLGLRSSNGEE